MKKAFRKIDQLAYLRKKKIEFGFFRKISISHVLIQFAAFFSLSSTFANIFDTSRFNTSIDSR